MPQQVILEDIIKDVFLRSNGVWSPAAQYLRDALSRPEIWEQVREDYLALTAGWVIRYKAQGLRTLLLREESTLCVSSTSSESTARIRAAANYSLLDYPLAGGLRLGAATRGDVIAAAEIREEHIHALSKQASWFRAIAQRLPNSRVRVEEVLSHDQLAELRLADAA
jgi:hypothetical protein